VEAKRRLAELQRVQEEQMHRKDLRERYVQAMRTRGPLSHTQSKEGRNVQALDLEVARGKVGVGTGQRLESKEIVQAEALWEKGDLLDSLDLSSTKLKDKIGKMPSKATLDTQSKQPEESKAWLHTSIRQSIKEWAPNNLKENSAPAVPTPKPVPAKDALPTLSKALPPDPVPKQSKKVSELRGKVQRLRQDEVLTSELRQIEAEERKMMESINRLDLALGNHQVSSIEHVSDYTSKPRPKHSSKEVEEAMVSDSVAKLSEILERRSEAGTDVGSVVSAPYSACSAPIVAVTKIKSKH